ncbi:hypothetical protein HRG_000148 [Hirsutella rhossiliensis]|uniref:DUF1254-domain-containing protein n=1 Tax=Hirsutella rhossiliensis TaxID=111463 RepID=A0A9P8SNU3_9HYPO|nr:uncharacterized protein HRG_00148 [Hirsutella rhossiliensis]KAH0967506.1 hypothetical protein HRG_00148 [Hirsutella rhossiliensis]
MLAKLSTAALALGALLGHVGASPTPPESEGRSLRATNATAFALTYGYPLIQYASTVSSVLAFTGSNAIQHNRDLATPDDVSLVRPSVDTLYSRVVVDLSHNDVSITIPKVDDDRYYVVAFHDLWSNNFANLGSLNKAAPGKYLLRIADKPWEIGFWPVDEEEPSNYIGYIGFPTIYGLVAPRILVRDGAADLAAVRKLQDKIKVDVVPRPGPRLGPRLTSQLLGDGALEPLAPQSPASLDRDAAETLLEIVAKVDPFNRPANPADGSAVTKILGEAGLANDEYDPPRGVDFALANRLVDDALSETDRLLQPFNNGWFDFPPQYSGDFGNNYAVRARVAFHGYGQLVQSEAIYPEWKDGTLRGLYLEENEAYLVTFASGKPPVRGFWSLTAYDDASRLIANPQKRYALGDRSPLAYSNGELVYGKTNRTDAFSILVQPGDVAPPSNWTSNWLPAPAGGGDFSLTLRLFGPTRAATHGGEYVYPVVTKQRAIVG